MNKQLHELSFSEGPSTIHGRTYIDGAPVQSGGSHEAGSGFWSKGGDHPVDIEFTMIDKTYYRG